MKLVKVLDIANQIEKSSFFKLLDSYSDWLKCANAMVVPNGGSKCINDSMEIKKIFDLVSDTYRDELKSRLDFDPQLLILANIVVRDGNAILERNWLEQLYRDEHDKLAARIAVLSPTGLSDAKARDYRIFRACVAKAYWNDEEFNHAAQITRDEKSILNVLANELEFSYEEMLTLYAAESPLARLDIDALIALLKEAGIGFYSRKNLKIYIPDEVVGLLRQILGIELPNKYLRRILKQLQPSQLNRLLKKYNIVPRCRKEK
ncbi:MAG: hypothetical protein PHQ27_10050 [Victivallales bacterium]|nr:hypothetical protein [Victivallales bacterium]